MSAPAASGMMRRAVVRCLTAAGGGSIRRAASTAATCTPAVARVAAAAAVITAGVTTCAGSSSDNGGAGTSAAPRTRARIAAAWPTAASGGPVVGVAARAACAVRQAWAPMPALCKGGSGGHDFKTRVVGNYENRIRRHANPEKVFEYFASVKADNGEFMMTPADFVRAVTPYNPYIDAEVGSRNAKFDDKKRAQRSRYEATPEDVAAYTEYIRHIAADDALTNEEVKGLEELKRRYHIDNSTHVECVHAAGLTMKQFDAMLASKGGPDLSPFYHLIDSNGDGLIDYAEYAFFVTVLSVPMDQFEIAFRMFDVNGDGTIDRLEFAQLMELMRNQSNQGRQVRDGKSLRGPKGRVAAGGQFPQFFGEAGDKSLSLDRFRRFVTQLQDAIHEHEFMSWDHDHNGSLSAKEFGMSLVAYASGDTSKYLARAAALDKLDGRISKAEFMAFQSFLAHLDKVEIALHMATARNDGAVDQSSFRRAAAAALKAPALAARARGDKVEDPTLLSPLQVQVLFTMFDEDGDGCLATDECIEVLRSRATRALDKRRDLGIVDMMGRMAKCFTVTWS